MRPFNALAADLPIFGPHLLEASAGTGKTFAIEQVLVRLLLEGVELQEILAITFTRSATRDLKVRIRSNIQRALSYLMQGDSPWEYLKRYEGAERKLQDALALFDQAQIFTIHGFCFRMLQEYALEAGLPFSVSDPDALVKPPRRVAEIKAFLEGVGPDLLLPEQVRHLFKAFSSWDELARELERGRYVDGTPISVLKSRFQQAIEAWNLNEEKLLEDFHQLAPCYKKGKGDLERQVLALARADFSALLLEEGTLFSFLLPSNEKKRAQKPASLHYAPFWPWCLEHLAPIVEEALDESKMLALLQSEWKSRADELTNPDQILEATVQALQKEPFCTKVRKRYQVLIVDEFQDTDPLQWRILQTLFLSSPLKALYLVGDPKQSIYRFRNADVYTYFHVKEMLGRDALFSLDTNFRSTPRLLKGLNALFAREWLPLPKLGDTIPCPYVKPGNPDSDEKAAIHFLMEATDEAFLLHAIQEMKKLALPLHAYAILVKDRYQMEVALRILQDHGIAARAKSPIALGKTAPFRALQELIEALAFPFDPRKRRVIALSPFAPLASDEMRALIQERGLIPLCQKILSSYLFEEWRQDLSRVIEELLQWEGRSGFSFTGALRFLEEFAALGVEEGGFRPIDSDKEGVEVLTIHGSKGLEFEVLFLLGAAAQQQQEDEEVQAEQFRQLYVAMTRAKERLYIPIDPQRENSLIQRFLQTLEKQEGSFSSFVARHAEVIVITDAIDRKEEVRPLAPAALPFAEPVLIPPIAPSFIQSFTALRRDMHEAKPMPELQAVFTPHTLPRGVETGLVIHRIFEKIFSSWQVQSDRAAIVRSELEGASLMPWTEAVIQMVERTLHLPLLPNFSLMQLYRAPVGFVNSGGLQSGPPNSQNQPVCGIEPSQIQTEMQFLFTAPPHYTTGFIDLVFQHQGKVYFVDWKTNWLGDSDEAYLDVTPAMHAHDYYLQASIYREAIERHVKPALHYGGAFYLFVRGGGICRLI